MEIPDNQPVRPTQDEFAKLVMDRLRDTGLSGDISYDAEQFHISVAGEKESALFLSNGYREYCVVSEQDRPHVLRRFVRGWLDGYKQLPEDFADLQSDILPAIRTRGFYESAELRMAIAGDETVHWPYQSIGDDLGVGLVYDLPDAMRSISNNELDGWGVTFYEALEVARKNLAELKPWIVGPKEGEGVYVFTTNDGYDASRLILLDLIRQFEVTGNYIAMVPGREMLVVAGSEDTAGLQAMVALAQKASAQPRPISGVALRLDQDDWVPWMPEIAHPLYNDFRLLRMQTYGQDYAEQKELLDSLHEKTGEDVFVASFSVMQHKDTGHRMSYCVWKQGALSLLPRTERIVLGGYDRDPIMVSWETVVEVAGDLLTPMSMYPERFSVDGFPTDEQLAAMGNELREE